MEEEQGNNISNAKEKILKILRERGPSLPIHIAKSAGIEMLFSSAFLSELVSDKTLKVSHMKVGNSPVYYLPEHKEKLENFSNSLPQKEKESFDLLKSKNILDDEKQEPAIRVALRNLKDFANPIQLTINERNKIFWYFHTFNEYKAREMIKENLGISEKKENVQEAREEPKPEVKNEPEPKSEINKEKSDEQKTIEKKEKPLLEIEDKTEFSKKVESVLQENNIEIIEVEESKKKDYTATIKIKTDIGKMKFLCIGKDIKRMSDNHILQMLQKSREKKMPLYLITTAENFTNKAKEYLEDYSGMIKVKEI